MKQRGSELELEVGGWKIEGENKRKACGEIQKALGRDVHVLV